MSKEHKFAKRKDMSVSDFKDQNLIFYDLPEEKNYVYTNILNKNLNLVNSIQKVQLTEAIVELVRADLGISIMAEWAISYLSEDETLEIIPFKSNQGKRTWYIASLSEVSLSEKMFINQVKHTFKVNKTVYNNA